MPSNMCPKDEKDRVGSWITWVRKTQQDNTTFCRRESTQDLPQHKRPTWIGLMTHNQTYPLMDSIQSLQTTGVEINSSSTARHVGRSCWRIHHQTKEKTQQTAHQPAQKSYLFNFKTILYGGIVDMICIYSSTYTAVLPRLLRIPLVQTNCR